MIGKRIKNKIKNFELLKKKEGKFWNEKARTQLLSAFVLALMVLTAFTGIFLMSSQVNAEHPSYTWDSGTLAVDTSSTLAAGAGLIKDSNGEYYLIYAINDANVYAKSRTTDANFTTSDSAVSIMDGVYKYGPSVYATNNGSVVVIEGNSGYDLLWTKHDAGGWSTPAYMGVNCTIDPRIGEHTVEFDGKYWMAYGDGGTISVASWNTTDYPYASSVAVETVNSNASNDNKYWYTDLVVYNGKLYCFYDYKTTGELWYKTKDSAAGPWSSATLVYDATEEHGLLSTELDEGNNVIFLQWWNSTSSQYSYFTYDGSTFSSLTYKPGMELGAFWIDNYMYMLNRTGSNQDLMYFKASAAGSAFTADEVVTDDFTGSNWNVTGNVVHNATGGYIWVKSDYGAGLKEGNAWWYPQYHTSHPITNLTLQVNYTGEIDQTGSNLGSNEIFINITLTNETGTTTSSPQVMVHRADFDTTYNETYTWNVVDIYQYRYVNISFYMAANATTDNLAWVTVRWVKLSLDTNSEDTEDESWIVEDLSAFGRAKSVVYDDNEDTLYVFYFDNSHRSADTHLCLKKLWLSNNTWSSKFTFPEPYYKVGGNMYGENYEHHITVAAQIDNNNYIWIVYGGHANADHPICSVRSNYPIDSPSFVWNDNSSWSAPVTVETDTDSSYPITYVSHNNTYCLYMRKGGLSSDTDSYMVVYWSFDNGTTWNSRAIADEAYSMTEWTYDTVNEKDLLFLCFGKAKTDGSSFTDTDYDFIWTTLDDIINGTGAYTSQQDVGDTPYYTFPVTEPDILAQDGIAVSANGDRYYNIQFDINTRNVYLAMGNDTDSNVGADTVCIINKTLGTANAWQITEIQNSTTLGGGDVISIPCDILLLGNKMFMLTLYNDTQAGDSTTYWKLRYGYSTTPLDNSSWTWINVTNSRYHPYSYSYYVLVESFLIPMDSNHIGFQIQVGRDNVTYTYDYGMVKYATIGDINYSPTISNPSPADGATDVSVSLSSWSCNISDADGDTMNWTIQTSPNIGSNSGNNAPNGSISCSLSGLQYSTSYTVYVNVTDGTSWTNNTYTFTTAAEKYFTDSGTAEPMTFPDTDINATGWVAANGNYLVITNNNKTIDGSTTWIMAFHPVLLNDTLLEYLTSPSDSTSWKCYAKIPEDDNVWHEVPASNSVDGWFYINDSIWDYSFDVGEHMYIRWAFNASNMTTSYAGIYSGSSAWNISDSPGYPSDYEYNLTVTLTGEQPPNVYPPAKPYAYTPSSGEVISEGEYSLMQCLVYDRDSIYLTVSFYWGNGTLIGVDTSVSGDYGIASIEFPDVEVGETYTWYAVADDGTYTNRSDNWTFTVSTGGEPPLVYFPSPANGATNISLLPTLSVLVYDTDSDSISVTFYDSNNITIGIDTFVNQMPPSPGQASVQWNNVILSNHTYEWYAVADDGDGNVVRYPTTGYLSFTTGITYPPVITFQVKDTSGFPLSDVNISCSNLNQQILQYATTNTGGFASFSFNYNDIGQTYDFVFKKANYTTVKKTYTIATGQYYITLQHKATPSGGNTTNPTDIATIFVNYARDNLGSTGLAFLSVILVILAMLIASKQFNAGNTATLFIGASLFGLFIALGWIPFWLLLLPLVLVALMFGGKIRDIIFGKSTGGDES